MPLSLHDFLIWKSELRKHGVGPSHGLSMESWMRILFQI